MGRVKLVDKGPRNIDLDILEFDNLRISDERLQIPHPLMPEREFVLRPLYEYALSPSVQMHASNTVQTHK
jgi:2-amino-4-hydroxy-6-hydroxymethyldihydropteridine diphosphokinase/dihydropteroate synthase